MLCRLLPLCSCCVGLSGQLESKQDPASFPLVEVAFKLLLLPLLWPQALLGPVLGKGVQVTAVGIGFCQKVGQGWGFGIPVSGALFHSSVCPA